MTQSVAYPVRECPPHGVHDDDEVDRRQDDEVGDASGLELAAPSREGVFPGVPLS